MCLKERLSIIEGPPGTGKTTVVATIVGHWIQMYPTTDADKTLKILICAPSNSAADNIAERLSRIEFLKGKYVRIVTEKLENIMHARYD